MMYVTQITQDYRGLMEFLRSSRLSTRGIEMINTHRRLEDQVGLYLYGWAWQLIWAMTMTIQMYLPVISGIFGLWGIRESCSFFSWGWRNIGSFFVFVSKPQAILKSSKKALVQNWEEGGNRAKLCASELPAYLHTVLDVLTQTFHQKEVEWIFNGVVKPQFSGPLQKVELFF